MESPRHLLYELPDDVLQYIVAYCVLRTMWALRGVNRALRKITARLAWRRALTDATSRQWLHDPTFQARVAATMVHPERDLYVSVTIDPSQRYHEPRYACPSQRYYEHCYVYPIAAAANVCLVAQWCTMNSAAMPCLRMDGPIGHLELSGVSYTSHRLVRIEHCASISLSVRSVDAIDGPLPPQLRKLRISNSWWMQRWEDVRRFVVNQRDVRDDVVVYLYRMAPCMKMRWRNLRRLFVDREPIRVGLTDVVCYDGANVTCETRETLANPESDDLLWIEESH